MDVSFDTFYHQTQQRLQKKKVPLGRPIVLGLIVPQILKIQTS